MRAVFLVALFAAVASANPDVVQTLGDGLWRTASSAFQGDAPALPLTTDAAIQQGWVQGANCQPGLGIPYFKDAPSPSSHHPLGLYFSAGGQLSGISVTIYGTSSTSSVGPAAQPQLVDKGFWIQAGFHTKDTWYTVLSFRAAEIMCSGETSPHVVGDRLIINQNTIAFEIPLTAAQARAQGYVPGSCLKTMGQHHILDLELGHGQMSWVDGNQLPIVPMYYPPGEDGTINAVYFSTPVVQTGSYLLGHADWDNPPFIDALYCKNWCDDNCHWTTHVWSTMHIYFNSQYSSVKCPGGSGLAGRACY